MLINTVQHRRVLGDFYPFCVVLFYCGCGDGLLDDLGNVGNKMMKCMMMGARHARLCTDCLKACLSFFQSALCRFSLLLIDKSYDELVDCPSESMTRLM